MLPINENTREILRNALQLFHILRKKKCTAIPIEMIQMIFRSRYFCLLLPHVRKTRSEMKLRNLPLTKAPWPRNAAASIAATTELEASRLHRMVPLVRRETGHQRLNQPAFVYSGDAEEGDIRKCRRGLLERARTRGTEKERGDEQSILRSMAF